MSLEYEFPFAVIEPASPGEVLHLSKVSITIDSENQVVWLLMAEFFPAGILWFAERANEMSLSFLQNDSQDVTQSSTEG